MANYHEDIVNIELESGNIHRSFLHHSIGAGDDRANRFGVRVFRNGEPENVSGSCFGLFIRADGATVPINNGVVSGNVAYVTLPDTCYAVEGQFCLTIKVSTANDTTTLRIVDGVVSRTSTNAAVDPGTIIPSIEDLIDAIEEAVDSIPQDYSDLVAEVNVRSPKWANINRSDRYALTASYADNVYTITVNKDFDVYGIDEHANVISIGHGTECSYPMPDTITSDAITDFEFAYLCFDKTDTTTTTWQIVNKTTMKADLNLCPVMMMYHDRAYCLDEGFKTLLTNTVSNAEFLNYEYDTIQASVLWYQLLHNQVVPITGKINLIPSEYKIQFENVVVGPTGIPGQFNANLQSSIEIDWSDEPHPGYARFIYFDNTQNTFIALCYQQGHPTTAEAFTYRTQKNGLALIAIVYNGRFIWTCGSLPGRWYSNGIDIYAANASAPELFKSFRKMGVIGDSLSVGYMYNKDTETATSRMLAYSWPKQVMKDAGVPWLNLGTSGQNVLTWCSNATYGKVQAEASGNKCQAYIIGLGENDQSDSVRGIPLGTASDIVDDYTQVATTYYGGYNRIIQILKHLNADCKIFCLTNPRRGGNARAAYNEAVRYIATEHYDEDDNVFLVDLANDESAEFNSGFLPADSSAIQGGHYSAAGYARIATVMEEALNRTMEASQTKFVDIAFIAYDTNDPTANTMTE